MTTKLADVIAAVTPEVLAAAAIAEKGDIDPDFIHCVTCGDPALAHGALDGCTQFVPDPVAELARTALAALDRDVMDDITAWLDAQYVPSGRKGPSPSDAGGCPRQIWYRDTPPADYVPAEVDRRRAALGQLIHKAAETARKAAHPHLWHEIEVEVPGLRRGGRVDEYDPVLGEVRDHKSAGVRKFEIVTAEGPTPDAWAQANIYALVLDAAGLPVRRVRIFVINRDTGREEQYVREFDPAEAQAALDELVDLDHALQGGLVPPRHPDAVVSTCWRCDWCEAKAHCWQLDAAAAAGRSPESYDALGPDPIDPVVHWAGERAIAASSARLAAEKIEKAAAALVVGVKPGTYDAPDAPGDPERQVVIGVSPHTSASYKKALENVGHYYEMPDSHRPPWETVSEVPRSVTYNNTVKRPPKKTAKKKKPAKQ